MTGSEDGKWDAFISHASEDKDDFVRPLAEGLRERGLKVWFDEFELKVGDNLRGSIDRGLSQSRFGIVVFSPQFFEKQWPKNELSGLVTREINGAKVILAIIRRRLPDDWTERYNTTPVLIETFVETPRYTGAVYRASGWIHVGATKGRGHYDRDRQYDKPKKDVWLRPLRRDWKGTLNR